MPTQRTPNAGLQVPQAGDRNWGSPWSAFAGAVDALAAVGSLAVRPTLVDSSMNPSGLSVTVAPGSFLTSAGVPVAYAGGAAAVGASATTLLWLDEAGVLTTGSAWPATPYVPLASVAAGGTDVTSVADARTPWRALPFPTADANQAALTDSTGGAAGTTLAAVGATNAADQSAAINANFASQANLLNAVRAALVARRVIKGSA